MLVPDSKVKLISSDGIAYLLDYEVARLSCTLKIFFDSSLPFKESATRAVVLPIKSHLLSRIVDFMNYKYQNIGAMAIPEFKIEENETMDLLDAASYLRV